PSIQLPNQDAEYVSHIAIDIGGSLIKLVYFSPDPIDTGSAGEGDTPSGSPPVNSEGLSQASSRSPQQNSQRGKLHFVKFETNRVEDAINFIEAKGLHRYCGRNGTKEMRVKATGGGAYKYADVFKERLGVVLEKEDEMACLVSGCNFLLKAIHHEAFTYEAGATTFVPTNEDSDLYPYLLVNIGSGVSMVKVSGDNLFERVSGSSIGGGTYWGLCQLLTQRTNFDEMLELSVRGDNSSVDMLVGDIYGGRDYASIGLSATTIASSFGKVVTQDKSLADYNPADMCLALCRMVAYNIGQLAHMNAVRHGIKRIFFGGFFIRGHPYTMETISYAIRFWSKGEMAAMFLRHEGFLGAVGAFLKVHPIMGVGGGVRARFVERFSMGAPLTGGAVVGPAIRDVSEKVKWVEKFVGEGGQGKAPVSLSDFAFHGLPRFLSTSFLGLGNMSIPLSLQPQHLPPPPSVTSLPTSPPTSLPAPQLFSPPPTHASPQHTPPPNTRLPPTHASPQHTPSRAFGAHLDRLQSEPGCYGALGLAELFTMREECLREFGFGDVYRLDKQRENAAALAVLPDLLRELDAEEPLSSRLLSLVEGVLAANIFDWGSQACVALYRNGTILDIYRSARLRLSKRPWAQEEEEEKGERKDGAAAVAKPPPPPPPPPYRRVMMFVDNSGADIVLGMLPFAREMLKLGCEVVLVANSLPAINDITAPELRALLSTAAAVCPVIKAAREAAIKPAVAGPLGHRQQQQQQGALYVVANGQGSPCLDLRRVPDRLGEACVGVDLLVIEGMGRAIHTNLNAKFTCDVLKLAMIKTERLAKKLFNGALYDCVCIFDQVKVNDADEEEGS
ncbi:hypothetical protein VOLCADRAFT_61514, partial [Volvox carteri f. nagariensis]